LQVGYGRFEVIRIDDSWNTTQCVRLDNVLTLYRGIRKVGFSKAWNMFVQLGMTDDYIMEDSENMELQEIVNSFLPIIRIL
jgi:hypothetical protein